MNDQKNSRPGARGPRGGDGAQRFNVLYSGALSREHGIELLGDAFVAALHGDPRLHLVVAGGGPAEEYLRRRIGAAATFLGWLERDRLAPVYAGADLLVAPSGTERSGGAILEAQARGLPVLAVDEGAASELIESGRSGCLVAAEAEAFAAALRGLARRAPLRDRLAAGGLRAARRRPRSRPLPRPAGDVARAA